MNKSLIKNRRLKYTMLMYGPFGLSSWFWYIIAFLKVDESKFNSIIKYEKERWSRIGKQGEGIVGVHK